MPYFGKLTPIHSKFTIHVLKKIVVKKSGSTVTHLHMFCLQTEFSPGHCLIWTGAWVTTVKFLGRVNVYSIICSIPLRYKDKWNKTKTRTRQVEMHVITLGANYLIKLITILTGSEPSLAMFALSLTCPTVGQFCNKGSRDKKTWKARLFTFSSA